MICKEQREWLEEVSNVRLEQIFKELNVDCADLVRAYAEDDIDIFIEDAFWFDKEKEDS